MKMTPILAASAALTLSAMTAFAGPHEFGPSSGPGSRLEQRIERMTDQLDLSTEQQDKVSAILEQHRAAQLEAMKAVRQEIRDVLTDAQRQELADLQQQRIERRLDRLTSKLDLSDDQRQQLAAVMETNATLGKMDPGAMREEFDNILTDEQKDQMARMHHRSKHDRKGAGRRDD